ncbi:endoplasmic reticulum translocation complex subunit Sec66 [Encephalitozoon hellem ATCC 50504]|uniref:Endoplasmic reticulum translocation complex subunit Sec66 n=1 Tax=Encephalitozoon hellem TaxID=27973 RepID=A0A9Q9F968_ENCHE|nr:endoplasmic reticulum translocation complex subunit Sec66 [Encephalitozoon hellem ATCC 50504]AFM98136.1 endoplasmic reticulum translocation complex subunit Sec66 [Encephalitozoon hellem ATCC 50504]UTX42981.1 endoplasmic reticulum translocation complex subunit Sec66 [Encephalitozoon hellem]WEL38438.1 endoplasmic reticulum translocation complex subunit Sec66 [Encephalitozoon hellem]|eukprot:XP_003887117.1 endoplasmic reticulum translocation complex subunit Sec66 [Encephalitozoon hellem ATCC 50504]
MILLLAMILSTMILIFSFIKRINRRKASVEENANPELEMYFLQKSEGAPSSVLLKQLLKAAVCFRERVVKLEKDMEILGVLYEDRMISEEHWERINEESKNCEVEKICIESEANIIKHGYGEDIFKDASKISTTSTKKAKGPGDNNTLYQKKKEVLELELLRKLGVSK